MVAGGVAWSLQDAMFRAEEGYSRLKEGELVYRVTGNDKPITRGELESLLATMNDFSKSKEERLEAAVAAAPYMHPLAPANKHEDDEERMTKS